MATPELIDLQAAREARRTIRVPEIGEDLAGARIPGSRGHLLRRVALALNSTLELKEVLHRLAELALAASGADRTSVFLLEGRWLRPTVALAPQRDDELWATFREMHPVHLDRVPSGWERLTEGRAVAAANAADLDLVPREWAETFGLKAVVLVPLLAAGEPCGLMVVDYARERTFEPEELRLLETMASYAGIAVRNARLYHLSEQRAHVQDALARGTAALVSPLDGASIARSLVDIYTELTGADSCAIGLLDHRNDAITTLAARGLEGDLGPVPYDVVPDHIRDRLTEEWTLDPRPVVFENEPWLSSLAAAPEPVDRHLVLPLGVHGRVLGAVVMGFSRRGWPDTEVRGAASTLAAIAAAALERATLLEQLESQLRRLEVLYGLSAVVTDRASGPHLLSRLNDLLSPHGFRVEGLAFRDRRMQRHLGGEVTREERAAWRRLDGCAPLADGTLAVPMLLGTEQVGTMRVTPALVTDEECAFLRIVAGGAAEIINRGALRTAVEDGLRHQAVEAERSRIAAELHGSVGSLFQSIAALARRTAGKLPARSGWSGQFLRLAQLADGGKWEIDQAIRALTFVPEARRGLVPALTSLARAFQDDSGIQVLFDVSGEPAPIAPEAERALYRVAHEATINAWRHARCAVIRIELGYHHGTATLRVRDDGVGLGPRSDDNTGGAGIRNLRRAVSEVGGTVSVRNATPRGVLVEAVLQRDG
ncbi:MAG TPA: GAF domain-containing protein [Nitriliruptorales bacterium]